MLPLIALDMDGTLNRFYDVPRWLDRLQAEDATPYYDCAERYDLDYINDLIALYQALGGRVCVVSWLAKHSTVRYDNIVIAAKMLWLRDNLPAVQDIRIVSYGTPKSDCVRNVYNSILFDDELPNRVEWMAAGGQARKPEYLTRTLERLVRNVLLHPVRA